MAAAIAAVTVLMFDWPPCQMNVKIAIDHQRRVRVSVKMTMMELIVAVVVVQAEQQKHRQISQTVILLLIVVVVLVTQ